MKVVRRSAARYGFENEIDGKMFSFCVVAESEVQAKRMAQAMGNRQPQHSRCDFVSGVTARGLKFWRVWVF